MVLLTPREHFICHWLLVKIYHKGTEERNKMLCAFWYMRKNPSPNYKRYINARAYEKLRNEYVNNLSNYMKIKQCGINNSNYGLHWFTNRNTGECKHFKIAPDETWVKGKNLFRGQTSKINMKKIYHYLEVKRMWNEYHSGNFENVEQFCKSYNYKDVRQKFRRLIPYYQKLCKGTKHNRFYFPSNKKLINKFK